MTIGARVMAAIDLITAHYESIAAPKKIDVPEWGLTLYATPVTLAERTRIYGEAKGDNDYSTMARVLVIKAQDADGKKLFTIADIPALLHKADPAVVIRVAAEILNRQVPTADELGKS